MNGMRSLFWLSVLTVVSVVANFALSMRTSAPRPFKRTSLVPHSFAPARIAIERAGQPRFELVKGSRWRLVEPYSGNVDEQVVLKMIDTLVFTPLDDSISRSELLKLGRSKEDFSLNDPDVVVSLYDGDETVRISFGCFTPTSNGVYAVVGGSDVVMVAPAFVKTTVEKDPSELRERDMFAVGPESVSSFSMRRTAGDLLEFSRDGDGWRLGGSTASKAKVMEVLTRVSGLKAVDFVWPVGASNEAKTVTAPLLAGYGLDSDSAITLTFHCSDGSDRILSVGNDAGERKVYAYVHGAGEIVTIDASFKDAIMQQAGRFADERIFPIAETDVTTFGIVDGDTSYVVAHTPDGAWRLESPVVASADADAVKSILGRMLALTVSDVAAQGLRVSVNTNSASAVVSASLLLGTRGLETLRSREVLRIDPALVKRIVSAPGEDSGKKLVSVVYSRDRRAWSVENADGGGFVDESGVKKLLDAINPLKADRIIALKASPAELVRYGLEKPVHRISIDQEAEGSVRRNILIGRQVKDGCYATVGSSDAIFVISKKTIKMLLSDLLDD